MTNLLTNKMASYIPSTGFISSPYSSRKQDVRVKSTKYIYISAFKSIFKVSLNNLNLQHNTVYFERGLWFFPANRSPVVGVLLYKMARDAQ